MMFKSEDKEISTRLGKMKNGDKLDVSSFSRW